MKALQSKKRPTSLAAGAGGLPPPFVGFGPFGVFACWLFPAKSARAAKANRWAAEAEKGNVRNEKKHALERLKKKRQSEETRF